MIACPDTNLGKITQREGGGEGRGEWSAADLSEREGEGEREAIEGEALYLYTTTDSMTCYGCMNFKTVETVDLRCKTLPTAEIVERTFGEALQCLH